MSGALAAAALAALWLSRRELRRARQALGRPRPEGADGWVLGPRPKQAAEVNEQEPSGGAAPHPEQPETELGKADGDVTSPPVEEVGGALEGSEGGAPGDRARSNAALIELLDDSRPSVRRNAVVALAIGGGAEALRGLAYAATKDPSVEVRREAILGLRSLVGGRSASSGGRPRA